MKYYTFILLVGSVLSGCVYYEPIPDRWAAQVEDIESCSEINGAYELNQKDKINRYNRLKYFLNIPISGENRVNLPKLTSINIEITDINVRIDFLSQSKIVHQTEYLEDSIECQDNVLTLELDKQYVRGGLVDLYEWATISIFKSKDNNIFVKRKSTSVGGVIMVPSVIGENTWFKLIKVKED